MATLKFIRAACLLALVLPGFPGAGPVFGDTVTLPALEDAALFQASPENNLGGMEFMPVGTTSLGDFGRGLLRFDLAGALPEGAVLGPVSLELTVVQGRPFTSDSHNLHRLLRPWSEGSGAGGGAGTAGLGRFALTGETTWNQRLADQASWGSPGAEAGVDYLATPSASVGIGAAGPPRRR
jgi:hypothetical protein